MQPKISIVGGGLVGSLCAVLLRQKGFAVSLFEKRPDMRRTTQAAGRSINLVITSRGLRALEQAGLLKEALALSVPVSGRMIHSRTGELSYQPYGMADECNYSVSRGDLNKFLLEAAERVGTEIFFDHSLENVDFQKKILIFSTDKGSISRPFEVCFGADGAGSVLRRKLVDSNCGRFQESVDWLEADYKELMIPAGPNGQHRLEKNALHIWPRGTLMMMALANLDGTFTVTLYMPKQGATNSFDSVLNRDAVQSLFEREFPDAISLMPTYLKDFQTRPQGAIGTVRCSTWVYRDCALIGDAAHAIVPFFGQGMNCGFEDCTSFLELLDKGSASWEETLSSYDRLRRIQTNAIAEMALENWTEMRDRVGDARFLLRKKVEGRLEEWFPRLYKSRYGMITYTLIPYALAQQAGRIQDGILTSLCDGVRSVDEIDRKKAEELIKAVFVPFLRENSIHL